MSEAPRKITISDVAAAAGVTLGTVSQALNDKGRLSPDTRAQIKKVAADLGYRPSVRAQRLRGGRSDTLALITALPTSIVGEAARLDFFLELALPIAHASIEHGYSLVLVPPVDGSGELDKLDVDGVIVVDPMDNDSICHALTNSGVKVVTIGDPGGSQVDGVVDRADGGADIMLAHLRKQGAETIAVLLSEESYSTSRVVSRYLRTDNNSDNTIAFTAPTQGGERAGYEAARRLLKTKPRIDAIYAPLDAFAVGAMQALTDAGLRVPEDVMVATNYDGRRASTSIPPLTTLDLNLDLLAQRSVDLLIGLLNGKPENWVPSPTPSIKVRRSSDRT